MSRQGSGAAKASRDALQSIIEGSDIIGRWDWDIPNDRIYADAVVALLFDVDPAVAAAGAPLDVFLESVHPEDIDGTARQIAASAAAGCSYVQEYRVLSADGILRSVLARGLIERDAAGTPFRGSGLLIDMTETRRHATAPDGTPLRPAAHPIERAAEHCIALRSAVYEQPELLLRQMTDMLLLELGYALAKMSERHLHS